MTAATLNSPPSGRGFPGEAMWLSSAPSGSGKSKMRESVDALL